MELSGQGRELRTEVSCIRPTNTVGNSLARLESLITRTRQIVRCRREAQALNVDDVPPKRRVRQGKPTNDLVLSANVGAMRTYYLKSLAFMSRRKASLRTSRIEKGCSGGMFHRAGTKFSLLTF